MKRKDKDELAFVVRMGYRSLFDFFFVKFVLLYFIVIGIPDIMAMYWDGNPYWGLFLTIGFCLFLWNFGKEIVKYIQIYLDVRTVKGNVIFETRMKRIVGDMEVIDED